LKYKLDTASPHINLACTLVRDQTLRTLIVCSVACMRLVIVSAYQHTRTIYKRQMYVVRATTACGHAVRMQSSFSLCSSTHKPYTSGECMLFGQQAACGHAIYMQSSFRLCLTTLSCTSGKCIAIAWKLPSRRACKHAPRTSPIHRSPHMHYCTVATTYTAQTSRCNYAECERTAQSVVFR